MSVCSQNNNSKQTRREIPGFILKVKKNLELHKFHMALCLPLMVCLSYYFYSKKFTG